MRCCIGRPWQGGGACLDAQEGYTHEVRVPIATIALVGLSALAGCKRHAHATPTPVPSASAVASAAPPLASAAQPTIVASAFEPGRAAYADGGAPRGYERVSVLRVLDTEDGQAVLLVDAKQITVLPIFIGGTEALTIEMRLEGEKAARPLTHDLLSSLVHELG